MIAAIRPLLMVPSMQARSTALSSDQVAQRWRDLADRRRSHFIELYESGRWKLYYTEAEFILRLREVFKPRNSGKSWLPRSRRKRQADGAPPHHRFFLPVLQAVFSDCP